AIPGITREQRVEPGRIPRDRDHRAARIERGMDDAGSDHAGRAENDDRARHGATCDGVAVPPDGVRARPRPVSARSPDIVPAQPHTPSADVIPAEAGIHWRFGPGATAKVDS